jgi:hypothetical protein
MCKSKAEQIVSWAERRAPSRLERIQLQPAETVPGAANYARAAKAGFNFGRGKVILPA